MVSLAVWLWCLCSLSTVARVTNFKLPEKHVAIAPKNANGQLLPERPINFKLPEHSNREYDGHDIIPQTNRAVIPDKAPQEVPPPIARPEDLSEQASSNQHEVGPQGKTKEQENNDILFQTKQKTESNIRDTPLREMSQKMKALKPNPEPQNLMEAPIVKEVKHPIKSTEESNSSPQTPNHNTNPNQPQPQHPTKKVSKHPFGNASEAECHILGQLHANLEWYREYMDHAEESSVETMSSVQEVLDTQCPKSVRRMKRDTATDTPKDRCPTLYDILIGVGAAGAALVVVILILTSTMFFMAKKSNRSISDHHIPRSRSPDQGSESQQVMYGSLDEREVPQTGKIDQSVGLLIPERVQPPLSSPKVSGYTAAGTAVVQAQIDSDEQIKGEPKPRPEVDSSATTPAQPEEHAVPTKQEEPEVNEPTADSPEVEASSVPPIPTPVVPTGDITTTKGLKICLPPSMEQNPQLSDYFNKFVVYTERVCQVQITRQGQPGIDPRVLACIESSRIGSDVASAATKAGWSSGERCVLVIIHPRAVHKQKVYPTRDKTADFVKTMEYIVDVVEWNNEVYECEQNNKAAKEFADHLKRRKQPSQL